MSDPTTPSSPASDVTRLLDELDKERQPSKRSVIFAIIMLLLGLFCAVAGIVSIFVDIQDVPNLLFLGTILLIPGGYQTYIIFQAYRRRPGFDIAQVPVYDA